MTNNVGRPRTVEREAALAGAMRQFRTRGYEATSMKDLERATGLLPGSLHHGFGGKQKLFLAALDHYNERVVRVRIATYLKGEAPVEEIRALFRSTLDEPGGGHLGCLLTNTAVELSKTDKAVANKVQEGFEALRAAFEVQSRRIASSKRRPRKGPTHASTALRLLHAYQGLLVLVRFGYPRAELLALVDTIVDDIFGGRT